MCRGSWVIAVVRDGRGGEEDEAAESEPCDTLTDVSLRAFQRGTEEKRPLSKKAER